MLKHLEANKKLIVRILLDLSNKIPIRVTHPYLDDQ